LLEPIKQIAYNSGYTPDSIIEKIKEKKDSEYGFDFSKGEYVNMIKSGIVDPLKVVRSAFQNAISVASILLTANTAIVLNEEKTEPLDK
jgi:chaperonin GroEL